MRHITQGETAYFVLTPAVDWQPERDEAEVRFIGRGGRTAVTFATHGGPETAPVTAHRNGRLSFILTPEQTARMEGRYRIEIRIACSGSVSIRSRWRVRVHPSTQGTQND